MSPKNSGPYLIRLRSKLQRLYSTNLRDGQLEYFPGLCGPYFEFSDLYDYIEEKGLKADVEVSDGSVDEWKKHLWQHCKIDAEIRNLKEIAQGKPMFSPEETKEYAIKLYKSELVCQYLIRKFNRGERLEINTEIELPIMWDESWEKKVQEYLITKTINLIE